MPKKVFELAKEIGVGAVDLVDKLKGMGMDVRNHMVVLSDDDVTKAMEALAPKPKVAKKKKVTKKKASKKKIVKKVTKKATEKDESDEEVKAETAKVEVKKIDEPIAPEDAVISEIEADADEPKTVKKLTVVTRKKAEVEKAKEEKAADAEAERNSVKEVYKEKMHAFTPVFTPPAKTEEEKKKIAADKEKQSTQKFAVPGQDDPDLALDGKKGAAKKRMGDLAAIVAKKGTGKAKDMTQVRADEELKFASTVMGRVLYSPSKRKRIYSGAGKKTEITEVKDSKRVIQMYNVITAAELSQKLSQKWESFQGDLLDQNLLVEKIDYIGVKLAEEMAAHYGYRVENRAFDEEAVIANTEVEDKSGLPIRNPVIAVMGHVDHGKTTLLDQIRKSKVTDGEAGGITQHIGAYSVTKGDATLTFLDTPGHAAFASMRQRGADVTDLVILVVAADDGVMPQTKESIKFAKKSGTPIIVAVNKMDKEGANPERIKQELTEFELVSEEWGGDTQFIPVSALNGDGIDDLLEGIKLQAEVLELRADPKGRAEGVIIESKIESGRGPVATIVVQRGTLKKGDSLVVGECFGRARTLMDHAGKNLTEAGPSVPVQILGLNSPPSPGDIVNVVKSEREARKIAENRIAERKALENVEAPTVASLEDFFSNGAAGEEKKILNLIVRSDVQGSYEAIKEAITAIGNDEVGVEIIAGGVGAITDNDVMMATNANGYIIGFNMRPVTSARKLAEEKGVEVRTYSIIYKLIDEVTLALEGMLEPETTEKYIGRAEVKDTFSIPKVGTIAGCGVIDGKIERGCHIRLLRDGKIMYDGRLSTLKRFKDEVKEVANGFECGMALEGHDNIKTGDLIEAYLLEEKARHLETESTL